MTNLMPHVSNNRSFHTSEMWGYSGPGESKNYFLNTYFILLGVNTYSYTPFISPMLTSSNNKPQSTPEKSGVI